MIDEQVKLKSITVAQCIILIWCIASCNFSEKEIYRISYNYQGNILILSGLKDGSQRLYEGGGAYLRYSIYRYIGNSV